MLPQMLRWSDACRQQLLDAADSSMVERTSSMHRDEHMSVSAPVTPCQSMSKLQLYLQFEAIKWFQGS